eukprot:TRINITY_DN70370_c0_g1_i1.p1 TRINITY_DN70370_c0_g1~~TRINITY_DN70370_c0_g1_i1.p1  ORF type:complete len:403 (+),score=111.38 TRINITY_DN70370_c0_g1_i1:92-1300(+)
MAAQDRPRVGLVGYRGMVGSVLMDRMKAEGDFDLIAPVFFSTSRKGEPVPDHLCSAAGLAQGALLADASSVDELRQCDVIISCQGGDYTQETLPRLREAGWDGHWIDAASAKRMDADTIITLPPVNRHVVEQGLRAGVRNYAGGNCTVSLMLIALGGLFEQDAVEWLSSMTYQAASGAGAAQMQELAEQMGAVHSSVSDCVGPAAAPPPGRHQATVIDERTTLALRGGGIASDGRQVKEVPVKSWPAPLAGSLLPWIDRDMGDGQTREEWKGMAETNKILGRPEGSVPVDGVCVRVGVMRCHSQAFMIKLRRDLPLEHIAELLSKHNSWCKVIPNEKDATLSELTPTAVSGKLQVHIGRLRKMAQGPEYLAAFSVGDQLLWGAAEPLRVTLRMILSFKREQK